MNIILVMIPLALLMLVAAVWIFFWATNHGQFDDMDSPGLLPMSDNLPADDDTPDTQDMEPEAADATGTKGQNQPQKETGRH